MFDSAFKVNHFSIESKIKWNFIYKIHLISLRTSNKRGFLSLQSIQ
jgi:hypothetical protein